MRYKKINNRLYINNRENYLKKVNSNSISIFVSNDPMPTNADETLPFVQDTNLLYLTGIDQEDTFLILAPNFPDESMREILFIKETSEEILSQKLSFPKIQTVFINHPPFVLGNPVLIISGSLVGASGLILTRII